VQLCLNLCPKMNQASWQHFQVTFAHDVVATENASGFVPGHLHCHALWNSRSH
jgi:hypothetical protein